MKQFNLTLKEDGTIDTVIFTYDENCNRICKRVTINDPEKLINIFNLKIKNNYTIFKQQVEELYKNLEVVEEILQKQEENKE